MFPVLSTCAKHVGNGRSTSIGALGLSRRPRLNGFLEFLFKRRTTFSDNVTENALTLPRKIGRLRIKEPDMPTKPLIQCFEQLCFERQAVIIQYPIRSLQPIVQGL